LLFVLFYVVFVCKCVLPPGDKPVAVNKYIKLLHLGVRNHPRVTDLAAYFSLEAKKYIVK
jgi:hypothetical protein